MRGGRLPAADALATLSEWREQDLAGAARDPHVLLVCGALHAAEGNHVEALKACNAGPQTLEMCVTWTGATRVVCRALALARAAARLSDERKNSRPPPKTPPHTQQHQNRMAICVQCYLLMDRVDRAEAQAKAMSAADDDATASQLAAAWVGAELGGAKVQEACYIYQELGDKYMWTVRSVLDMREASSSCRLLNERSPRLLSTPPHTHHHTQKNQNSPRSTTASPSAA